MIFTIIGTHHQPFSRLLNAVDALNTQQERVIQTGHTPFESDKCRCLAFMPFDEVRDFMKQAETVITHAGTGTVMLALSEGKCPVVAPRYAKFGEHVDDHQEDLVQLLEKAGSIVPWYPGDDLAQKIEQAHNMTVTRQNEPAPELVKILREYVGLKT